MMLDILTSLNPFVSTNAAGSSDSGSNSGSTNDSSSSSLLKALSAILSVVGMLKGGQGADSSSNGTDGTSGSDGTSGTDGSDGAAGGKPPVTGNLVADGQAALQSDEGKAMQKFNKEDPEGFAAFENALKHGDGNTAASLLADAVKDHKLTTGEGAAIGAQLQQTANMQGGGKINGEMRDKLKDAIGTDVLAPGMTASDYQARAAFSKLH